MTSDLRRYLQDLAAVSEAAYWAADEPGDSASAVVGCLCAFEAVRAGGHELVRDDWLALLPVNLHTARRCVEYARDDAPDEPTRCKPAFRFLDALPTLQSAHHAA